LEDIERNRAAHLSLMIGDGPRLDLFEYPMGKQQEHTSIRMLHSWWRRAVCRTVRV
jgi:hypothetical protein